MENKAQETEVVAEKDEKEEEERVENKAEQIEVLAETRRRPLKENSGK